MIKKLKVSSKTYYLIQETCERYTKEFRKHRKSVNLFSSNGNYQEWQKNKYRNYNNRER